MIIFINGYSIKENQAGVKKYICNLIKAVIEAPDLKYKWVMCIRKEVMEQQNIEEKRENLKIITTDLNEFRKIRRETKKKCTIYPDYYITEITNSKQYVIYHDLQFRNEINNFKLHQKLFRYLVYSFNEHKKINVLTISANTKKEIKNYYPNTLERTNIIGSGAVLSKNSKYISELDKKEYIISIGTLNKHKNYINLIKAFKKIKSDVYLVIAGKKGNNYDEIKKFADEDERIIIYTDLCDQKIKGLYEKSIGVVLPSLYEGYGLPLAESLCLGKNCRYSNIEAFKEINNKNEYMFNALDVSEIKDAINEIIGNRDKNENLPDEKYGFTGVLKSIEEIIC